MVGIFDTDSGFDLETTGIVFMNTLNDGYKNLSMSRTSAFDLHDGEHFNYKARTAARRSVVIPDEITDRELNDDDRAALSTALLRLRRSFLRGAREVAPVDVGYAQVAYDCWIEAAEDGRGEDAARCRDEFNDRMARVEELADYGVREAGLAPPELIEAPGPYMVYFQWDSTTMTQAGQESLQQAIGAALADPNTAVDMVGHADRSGPDGYNQRLSERRVSVVKEAMEAAGIDTARITSGALGESNPFVATPDGVRHPGNRVVRIELM